MNKCARLGWVLVVMVLAACSKNAPRGAPGDAETPTAPALPHTIACHDSAWPAVLAAVDAYCAAPTHPNRDAHERAGADRSMDCSTMRSVLRHADCPRVHRRGETFNLVTADFEVRFRVDAKGAWTVERVLSGF